MEVRITPQDMVILSYPGPDRSVRLEQLRLGRAMPRRYRNRRIGEFFKELDLTEGRSTGIPKILRAMKANGSPPPEFEFDENHSYFLARLPVQPDAGKAAGKAEKPEPDARPKSRPESRPESGGESGVESGGESGVESRGESEVESIAASEMAVAILMALAQKPLGKKRLAEHLGKQRPTRYLDDLVRKLVSGNLIEPTIPDKPTSRLQQYRLTEKGRALLAAKRKGLGLP